MPHIYLNALFFLKQKIVRRIVLLMIEMRLRSSGTSSMSLTKNSHQTWQNCGAQLPAGIYRIPATTSRDLVNSETDAGTAAGIQI